ncbi:AraC family transcriptional regulator [Nocardia sp. CDC159]|uniref:AraC family transcriptional regulator n=1 Tax=Nocardia pulmonis TaxID=2951408 RepID=A0A9X2IX92_9NOCA|nr:MULTISPECIES: AraC family transcriptional regulator [Nocardia]MCM6775792.1 AraC family transcriptional regulator [Nocardia pulmonis]MCM6788232.1 AraC family transcriptional regulator [Nocardia sp. CDC159]
MRAREWVDYRRMPDRPVEAMAAHFDRHVYDPHSHDAYSFGYTEFGVQAFGCRGGSHASVAGMLMAFNPDEPHDGRSGHEDGFTYRIVHIGPELVSELLADRAGRPTGLPLFPDPVLHDPPLLRALERLYHCVGCPATTLARDEALARTVAAMVERGARHPPRAAGHPRDDVAAELAGRAWTILRERYLDDISSAELAAAVGCSRFTLARTFRARYGLAPSDFQRQLRLRAARRMLASGRSVAEAAVESGFADQAHLTRWFRRCYGITPGVYRTA